jgi:hypothetical protein
VAITWSRKFTLVARADNSRRAVIRLLAAGLMFSLSSLGAGALAAESPDGDALLKQIDKNLAPDSYEMYRKLIDIQPDGTRKEWLLYTVKKGSEKVLALFLTPASDKGRSTLRLAENLWLYIPGVDKPLRITSLQSVTGGLFNNADILRLDYGNEYSVQSMDTTGTETLLLLKARTTSVAYDQLKMWVNKQQVLPVKVDCFAASGLLIKTLHFKDVKDLGDGVPRPATVETDSPLYKGYKSLMIWAAIKPRKFPDEIFTLNYMPRVQELRR